VSKYINWDVLVSILIVDNHDNSNIVAKLMVWVNILKYNGKKYLLKGIGIGIATTFLQQYRYWYWQYLFHASIGIAIGITF